jgi:hypothetical protein
MQKRQKQLSRRLKLKPEICVIPTEGLEYFIDWDKFPVLGFVFIRCVGTEDVLTLLRRSAERNGIKISISVGIRNGYWGVGVWRLR